METARAWYDERYPDIRVTGLLQDSRDYLTEIEYVGQEQPRDGEAFVFIRKSNGLVWTAAPGEGFKKYVKMRAVPASPSEDRA